MHWNCFVAVLSPHNTKISEDAKHGKSLLLADTVEEVDKMLDNVLYNKKLKQSNKQVKVHFVARLTLQFYFQKFHTESRWYEYDRDLNK